jgi:hypothetical protein
VSREDGSTEEEVEKEWEKPEPSAMGNVEVEVG